MRNTLGTAQAKAGLSMKRGWAWVLGVGIGWALLAPQLASVLTDMLAKIEWSDWVLPQYLLFRAMDLVVDPRFASAVIAVVLTFVLVVFAKAPPRVWLGVLLGVALGWVWDLYGIPFDALLLGREWAVESLTYFARDPLLYGCVTVFAAWAGALLGSWWSSTALVIRQARDERASECVPPQAPREPDDWDEPFDTRADDARA